VPSKVQCSIEPAEKFALFIFSLVSIPASESSIFPASPYALFGGVHTPISTVLSLSSKENPYI
jgi:hypothetical protein